MSEIKKHQVKGEQVTPESVPEKETVTVNIKGLDRLYHKGMLKEAIDLGITMPRFYELMWDVYQAHKLCPKMVPYSLPKLAIDP